MAPTVQPGTVAAHGTYERSLKRTMAFPRAHRIDVYGLKPGSVPVAASVIRHDQRRPLESKTVRPDLPCDWTLYQPPPTDLAMAQVVPVA